MLVFGMCLGVLFGLRGSMLNAARLPCERIDELNAKASDISTDPIPARVVYTPVFRL